MTFDLQIRDRDQKCRAITRDGKPLTRWCSSGLRVIELMRQKEPQS